MKELDKNRVGLIVGSFVALMHLGWSLFVVAGVAQTLMDWIFGLHFLNNPFQVQPFSFVTVATLVVVTFVVGYVMGWAFTYLWRVAERKS